MDMQIMNGHYLMGDFRPGEKSKERQLPKREIRALLVMDNIGVPALPCVEQSQGNPACSIDETPNPGSAGIISIRIKRCGNETVSATKKGRSVIIFVFAHAMTRYNVD
jgi:hypothetical protein